MPRAAAFATDALTGMVGKIGGVLDDVIAPNP